MSFQFKQAYYRSLEEWKENVQVNLFAAGTVPPIISYLELRRKWEKLCLEQAGFVPEFRKQIPQVWKENLKRMNSYALDFLDCARDLVSVQGGVS